MDIRAEQPGDAQGIFELTERAFAPMAYSDGSEAPLVAKLRETGDLTLSLVAVAAGRLLGHVAFSPVRIAGEHLDAAGGGWFGLGPISVEPSLQRRGGGSALVRAGLSHLHENGAAGCALIGDPVYYGRFGFVSDGGLQYGDLPLHLVQWLAFRGAKPRGRLAFAAAFDDG